MASSSSHSPSNSVAYSTNPITSQTPSSFPSASLPTSWDVFLSFCGKDTRYNFTSHLYDKLVSYGIQTFMDDPELRIGEVITNSLVQAIHESKIYIIVFSQNYASSPWCLDELVQIYNCYEKMNRLVIGVYCNIDPSVVRHQKESFAKAFEDHRDRYAVEKVNDWRRTLKFVAGFSGKHVSAKRSEADIINEIVERVVLEINPKTLDVAKYPVGLDARVKDITTLLSTQTEEGVIKFGLYGMGGVGKTTLAKALYNQLLLGSFHGNCFLANVRDVSGRPNGIESLQQQLIDDVLRRKNIFKVNNVDEGINFMGDRIHLKKVLVVIDDVDDHKQFESLVRPFARGSVVIITTRDEELLDTIEVESRYRYKVSELDDADSLTLFTQHAFGTAKPNDSLIALFEDILHHAGGLPLALEVFGSYLYKRPEVGWRSFIEKLQRTPNNTIQQRLIISLDALESDDPMLKKLFLDIACFFIGCDKEWVVKRIESYYPYADHNINILRKKCLLTINNYDELGMHDLLRDMGREIGRNTYPDEPGKHSRLYLSEDICNVLKKYTGTEAIEGIYLNNFDQKKDALEGEPLFVETFKKMSKLRFLYLESSVSITGNFEHAFEDLRWLYWKYCPLEHLPSNFFPQKLGILELTYSKMRTMWEPCMVAQVFEKLKILNFSYSRDLTTTDFNKLPCLETLDLEGCKSLVEIHISIGSLVKLFSLNLSGCVNLRSLPDSICNLRALEKFNIGGCRCLEALPSKMGNMKSLTELEAYGLNLSKLPNSIGDLSKLVKLILYFNKRLETLPDSICNLRALEVLDISDCYNLKALPIELGNVKSLKELNVKCLNVFNIPDSVGHLSKVVELNLCYNKNLKTIPDTICNMRSLEILDISGCEKLEILPYQLWKITWLRELHVSYATMFKKLPDIESSHIAALSLNVLDLSGSGVTALPSGISQLLKLQVLNVGGCRQLLSITELPPNLEKLRACGCFSLKRIQNLSSLKWLEILDLENCDSLTKIVGLEGLASIKQLKLTGNNASFLNYTLTKSLFQTYSEFGHEIHITTIDKREFGHEIHLFPEWIINASCVQGSTLVLDFPPNVLLEPIFLGIVLCFESNEYPVTCIIKNTARNIIIWTGKFDPTYGGSMMVILPSSMVPLTAEGHTIDLILPSSMVPLITAEGHTIDLIGEYGRERIHAVHLLYKE